MVVKYNKILDIIPVRKMQISIKNNPSYAYKQEEDEKMYAIIKCGSKIYEEFPTVYKRPVVVAGFEPVDVMQAISMILKQFLEGRCELEVEYKRLVSYEGNIKAQELSKSDF